MRPLAHHEISGSWATLLLPIDEDDRIDFGRLSAEIDAIASFRPAGVYAHGTAGEFYALSEDEFDRVNALLADKCEAAKLPFQIGVSHTSAQVAEARLRRAKGLAPGAVQVILPDWFPLTDDEAVAFLDRMAAIADPVGLILYNPPHAKRVLTGELMRLLAERVPGVIGAKVGNVDAKWFDALGPMRDRLSVFTPGSLLATHLPMGSRGAYSNVACLHPGGSQRWYEQMTRDLAAGRAFQRRLDAFFDEHVTPLITRDRYPNAAVDKFLAAVGDWSDVGTRLRWPYRSVPIERATRLRALVRESLPELFAT